jgi:hypothetical protein
MLFTEISYKLKSPYDIKENPSKKSPNCQKHDMEIPYIRKDELGLIHWSFPEWLDNTIWNSTIDL